MSGHDFDPRKWVRIAADLRGQITSGSLPPGGRLPTVAELAALHHVGAGTITKAVHALVDEGLVLDVRGMGWYVRDRAVGA